MREELRMLERRIKTEGLTVTYTAICDQLAHKIGRRISSKSVRDRIKKYGLTIKTKYFQSWSPEEKVY